MRRAGVVVAVALLVAGCGAGDDGAAPQPASNESATQAAVSSRSPEVHALVGEWSRTTTCQQRADALEAAGLGRFAAEHAAGDGFVPGVTSVDQLEDPNHPCNAAVPQKHSHFFTADGLFGSRDAEGDQVDDGIYELVSDDSFVIGKEFDGGVTFHYEITADDELFLDPVMPACAEAGCFEAQWAIAVAYPGLPWERTG
jgi:hypothetical protein